MAGLRIEGLVRALREGDDAAKMTAARELSNLAYANSARAIAEAGGVPLLVDLLRDGSADTKWPAAWTLLSLAYTNAANRLLIAEAGGIPPLVELMRDGGAVAKNAAAWALESLAWNNDANAVAIALAIGLEALVQLARRGRVTYNVFHGPVVRNAGVPAKRKAALVVAALLRDCVPDSVPREIRALIGSYL